MRFAGWINPLKCPEIDLEPRLPNTDTVRATPAADRLLDYLQAPEGDRSREAFVARYEEIAAVPDPLPIVPAEPTVMGSGLSIDLQTAAPKGREWMPAWGGGQPARI